MSVQLKNAGKAKAFFLNHGEKLGVFVIACVAGWLVFASTAQEAETRKPNELGSLVQQVTSRINQFTWDQALAEADPPPLIADKFQAAKDETIDPDHYAVSRQGVNRPVLPQIVLRRDPSLLTPVDLEGKGFTVLMPFYSDANAKKREIERRREEERKERERELERQRSAEDAGNSRRGGRGPSGMLGGIEDDPNRRPIGSQTRRGEGVQLSGTELIKVQSCAVVLAKVPVEDQLKIYQETFENAKGYDASRDMPSYLGYFVERAEVRQGKELDWKPALVRNGLGTRDLRAVNEASIPAAVADWVQEAETLVDNRYFHPVLTFPLPGLVSRSWGPEVVHSDLPLASETEAMEAMTPEEDIVDPAATEDESGGFGFGSATGRTSRSGLGGLDEFSGPPGMGSRRGSAGLGGRRPFGGSAGSRRGGGMMPTEFMGPPGGGRSGRGGRMMGGSRGSEFGFQAPFAMLRFVDFNVQPGRQYRYRFQLVMLDVNGKGMVRSTDLEKEVRQRVEKTKRTRVPFIRTKWSEPSEPISVPLAGNVFVAEGSRSSTGDASVTLLVDSFDIGEDGKAIEATLEMEKVEPGAVMNRIEKDAWTVQLPELVKVDRFRFQTGITVLDIQGGRKLSRDTVAPASILVMDATGRLSVRSELEDENEVARRRALYSEDDASPGGVRDFSPSPESFEIPF